MITLENVAKEQEDTLHNMIQFYIYEFSKYLPVIKLEKNGTYKPFKLDRYWKDENFHAFFIKLEEELIGFALVESATESTANTIHEFFILGKHKGKGFGKIAATKLFNQFSGKWIITQVEKNYPAQAFWRSLLYKITDGRIVERYGENRMSIQEFHTDSLINR